MRRVIPRDVGPWIVPVAAIVVVALRLPLLNRAPTPDEAGFLLVGGQWRAGGSSLYGDFWVDRPPLLVGTFKLASVLGGLPALRLLGCLAAVMTVLGSATAAGLIAGRGAARWAAVTAAALLASPLLGTVPVNGELLASPFTAWGIAAAIAALRSDSARRSALLAATAGSGAMASLLIKQNLADAFVFGLVATLIAWRKTEIDGRRCVRVLFAALTGAAVMTLVVGLLAHLHGTPMGGVFEATYPFRLQAGRVMASFGRDQALTRLIVLLLAFVASGMALLLVMIARGVATRRLQDTMSQGLVATVFFGTVSVMVGGNYWSHYLVELIAPIAMITGVLVARHIGLLRPAIGGIAVVSLVSLAIWLVLRPGSEATEVGETIAAAARPGDSIVVVYGHADLVAGSGLPTPYRYLWSLPVRTLDPDLRELNRVLTGPHAPTWFVAWGRVKSWRLDSSSVEHTLRHDYHPVDRICGHTIYLRNGVTRPQLRPDIECPTGAFLDTLNPRDL